MRDRSTNVVKVSFVVALICVLSWVTIPFGHVPFTLQTLGIMIALQTLGGRDTLIAVSVYLLLGAVGLPVFSAFGSGLGVLFGPTGGFLFGFFFGTLGYAFVSRWLGDARGKKTIALLTFLVVCYTFGCAYYALAYNGGLTTALTVCVLPYIIPDILKLVLAIVIGRRIRRFI